MDEIDHIQEAATLAQEAMLAERRRIAELDLLTAPPEARDCSVCGEEIPYRRLKTLPRTKLCVDCATDAETFRR